MVTELFLSATSVGILWTSFSTDSILANCSNYNQTALVPDYASVTYVFLRNPTQWQLSPACTTTLYLIRVDMALKRNHKCSSEPQ